MNIYVYIGIYTYINMCIYIYMYILYMYIHIYMSWLFAEGRTNSFRLKDILLRCTPDMSAV